MKSPAEGIGPESAVWAEFDRLVAGGVLIR